MTNASEEAARTSLAANPPPWKINPPAARQSAKLVPTRAMVSLRPGVSTGAGVPSKSAIATMFGFPQLQMQQRTGGEFVARNPVTKRLQSPPQADLPRGVAPPP